MIDPEFDPREQDVINRLTHAPQPTLNPDALESIRARMLDAMDMPPSPQSARPGRQIWSRPPLIAAVVVTVLVASSLVVVLTNQNTTSPTPTSIPTSLPTFTVIPATVAPTAITPTEAKTTIPTASLIPEAIGETTPDAQDATATVAPVIVIEGPIQAIDGIVITIFGIDITLNPDDPILAVLQVGDVVHVEADYAAETTTIIAVTVEPVVVPTQNNEVNVNPSTGETWRDDGNCDHPPPPWAPANGWRRRCEAAPANNNPPGNGNGNGGGNGMGMGKGEGDD